MNAGHPVDREDEGVPTAAPPADTGPARHDVAAPGSEQLTRRDLGKWAAAGVAAAATVSAPGLATARTMTPERVTTASMQADATPLAGQTDAMSPAEMAAISTPPTLETSLGTLEFVDGMPSTETIARVYDNLDLIHGVDVFLNAYQGASTYAIRQGFLAAGAPDNTILLFSTLMDAASLFLTPNTDTVYFVGAIDLTTGPMVLETPPRSLGTIDDMWFRFVTDFGAPGPDRGEGGRYLLLPPDYDGARPDGGFYVAQARTSRVMILGRAFLVQDDPAPAVEVIKQTLKIYPYTPGGVGTSIATALEGTVPLASTPEPPPTTFLEASGLVFNTVPATDFTFYEQLDALVQQEPAGALDPELMGQMAAIGIVKGQPFAPDERMRRILEDAAAIGTATARTLSFHAREEEGFVYYPDSAWYNPLWVGGYNFETPPPQVTPDGIKPYPPTGARTLNARTAFFYPITGITPAMIMRLTNIGSQYLFAALDGNGDYFDGGKTYQVTLPPDIPAANFWSLTLYDNQTRSMLATPQRYPRAGSQSYPTPAAVADADGSTTVSFGPEQPEGVNEGNWIQTVPGKGWFVILRLYSPLEQFFDKTWRPSEIELVS